MRLPVDEFSRLSRGLSVIACVGLLAGCGTLGVGSGGSQVASAYPENGPQADYPVLVGEPYSVAGVEFTPSDTLNYDSVGYLTAGSGSGITAAHHTLPVPSYVEITSLTTGRTILARVERRGPMDTAHLLSLSPAAMAQLEATAETPVRVRRVNPPEEQRAVLRAGGEAPLRMDTPMSLVNVLKRQLPATPVRSPSALAAAPAPETVAPATPEPVVAPVVATAPVASAQDTPLALPSLRPLAETGDSFEAAFAGEAASVPAPASEPATITPEAVDGFVVQAAAFSTADRAERVANVIGGKVTIAGQYYRVRTGPFVTRSEAEASLANVRAAGYTDARILTSG